jgi:hypothetical protein
VRDPETMFASSTVPRHVVRGVLGLPLLVASLALVGVVGPVSLLLAVPATVLLRGCPTCWLLGLAQTRQLTTTCRVPDQVRGRRVT